MACSSGPNIVTDELVFAIDSVSQRSISALGCTGFNNAPQLIKNIVSQSDTITSNSNTRIGSTDSGFNFYTIFAIDYPEGNYGGSAAGRDGITPGFNVTSGTLTEDYSRALNYRVWNEDTEDWVPTSYHNGDRNSGRCYDSYSSSSSGGAAGQVALFVQDYNTIKQAFPRSIHIVAGSHRDSNHSNDQYDVLRDLGAPDNVNTIINFSSPEWILVGRPGLGAGNAYGWAFQNYSTNSSQVAHMNMSLPVFRKEQYLNFNGSSDYIRISESTSTAIHNIGSTASIECWFKSESGTTSTHFGVLFGWGETGTAKYSNLSIGNWFGGASDESIHLGYNAASVLYYEADGSTKYHDGNWHHVIATIGPNQHKIYVDGVSKSMSFQTGTNGYSVSNVFGLSSGSVVEIGRRPYNGGSGYFNGRISNARIYNKVLTAAEVAQNFNALRGRFGI
jgi:hypothetical protein